MRALVLRRTRAGWLTLVTLGLGLGVGVALLTVYWDVAGKPLPFPDDRRLASIWASDPERDAPHLELSLQDVEALAAEVESLSAVAAYSAANFGVVLARQGAPFQLQANLVTAEFFSLLGVVPAAGRLFTAAEHAAGAAPVAVLTDRGFRARFGGDPGVVGEVATFDGQPAEIVGVLPPRVDLPRGAEILFPLEPALADEASRRNRVLAGVGRLAPGATCEGLAAEATPLLRRLEEQQPDGRRGVLARAHPLRQELLGAVRGPFLALAVLGLAVVLIAGLNAGALALNLGLARARELAVRVALGAGRRALLAGFVREAAALALPAAALAAVVALVAVARFRRDAPATLPRAAEVGFGLESLLVLAAATLAVMALLACLPLLGGAGDVGAALRSGPRGGGLDRRVLRGLDALSATQMALALALLSGAAVALDGFRSLAGLDVGFARESVVTGHVPLPYTLGQDPAARRQEFRELLRRVRAIPGVEAAGTVLMRPLEMELGWDFAFTAEGQSFAEQERNPLANLLSATPGYFEAMGIGLLAGRTFGEQDGEDSQPVAVVGESFARRQWGGVEAALGRRLKSGKPDSDKRWVTIVGVVSTVRYRGITTAKDDVYVPFTQSAWSPNYLAVRTRAEPALTVPAVERALAEVFPGLPLSRVRTTGQLVGEKLAQPRLTAAVLGSFAASALLVAGVGLYGVLALWTRRRRVDLGVRLALGALPRTLVLQVARRSAALFAAGAGAGLAIALACRPLLRDWLAGGPAAGGRWAPWVGLAAVGIAAAAAAIVPAARAARTDPLECLREE
jgi:predicted permease